MLGAQAVGQASMPRLKLLLDESDVTAKDVPKLRDKQARLKRVNMGHFC
jgi:hypothetical protein